MENKGLETRVDHLEKDVCDLKSNDKDLFKDVALIKESHIETKIYLKLIQESQAKQEKSSATNQEQTLQSIEDLKNKPIKNYEQIKIAVWIFIATYIAGNIFGMMKIFAAK